MPGKIKVKVLAGRNLPVMDRASETTDAFVEIRFGGVTHKTDVCRKSLNPQWNSTEWYRFEVDESELQDEPLQLRVMDHDTYSANDAIGKVVISLAPLLSREPAPSTKPVPGSHPGAVMSGWIPVFDTMHGIRGELNVIVKVELFSDFNKYKTSSCGVQFFHCPTIPPGYKATAIHGFVEELVVNDDPEYQWIDKIRTPRASNEARQAAFIKLSNQVQRLVGLKASELGANAVVGYQQAFDLEGEAGVVARAIGTAISIEALPTTSQPISISPYTQHVLHGLRAYSNNKLNRQLKKYLDILATDGDSITDLNKYFETHQEELQNFLHILHPNISSNLLDDPENDEEIKPSYDSSIKNYSENLSIYQDEYISQESLKHIADDQTELNKLLCQEDKYYEEDNTGTAAKLIKKLKPSFLSKRFGSGRSKKSDKAEDSISIQSNSSDASRISMAELRNEFKKLKRLRKPKFRRSVSDNDDGVGMASILARSVMHAHTSLACIAETQDSEHSPCSTLKRASESEPKISTSDEEKTKGNVKISSNQDTDQNNQNLPQIKIVSHKIVNTIGGKGTQNSRKPSISCPNSPPLARMQNLLKLPGEDGYFGSISSALSGESSEFYSSTDDDDESSDLKTDTEKSIETTSSVVQSVLKHEANPAFISQMEKKLTAMEPKGLPVIKITERTTTKSSSETNILDAVSMSKTKLPELKMPEGAKAAGPNTAPIPNNSHHHHFKFHNPFAHKKASRCLSEPSSPTDKKFNILNRSSKRLKSQFAKLSKNSMIKSLSHIPLMPKKKNEETQIPRPHSSGSDIGSRGRDTVLGSPFMSYSDLLSLYRDGTESKHTDVADENAKVQMYIGSEPVSRMSLSGPSSPRSLDDKDDYHNILDHKNGKKDKECAIKPTGLLLTAMETILMDKVQSLLIPATPDNNTTEKRFFNFVNEKLEKVEEMRNKETEKINKDTSNHRKLVRQDSIHSSLENVADPSHEMSKVDTNDHKPVANRFFKSKLVLQHLHPIMSGPIHPKVCHLETIPSLPETSFDYSLDENEISLDVPTVEVSESETNVLGDSVVCDNSHAECGGPVPREKEVDKEKGSPKHSRHESYGGRDPLGTLQNSSLNASSTPVGIHRRSSDSDLSVTPKGSGQNASVGNAGGAILKPSMNSNNIDMLEYPFLTMAEYPPGFIVHLAGCVFSRSVKLVDGGGEAATRAAWWTELRTEIRAHMRALRCNAVLAYSETTAICEDVCVLSASGTAAVINLDCDFGAEVDNEECLSVHVPYSVSGGAYRPELPPCSVCGRPQVPRVLLAGVSRPASLLASPVATTVSAIASRVRRAPPQSEPGARDISDQLPFLEYELHKLLLAKLRMQGANAIFNLQTQIAVGERCVAALASGTAVRLNALPAPTPPRIKFSDNDKDALELQKCLWETFSANKTANGYDSAIPEYKTNGVLPEVENEENPSLDLCADKDACVLELDEAEEIETARSLCHRRSYLPVLTTHPSIKMLPKSSPYAFAQVWRGRFQGNTLSAEKHVARALDGVHYKLRTLKPCVLTPTRFQIELAEDEIQLVLTGAAIPLLDPNKPEHRKILADDLNMIKKAKSTQSTQLGQGDDEEIFTLEVDQSPAVKNNVAENIDDSILNSNQVPATVSLSPMGATGGRVRHVCALRLLFVRESTAVRELGGLSGFLHTAMSEVLAIVRAYTTALGGNTLTSFYITQLMLQDNAHKNQGQCLLSVGGDVVHLTY